jgi:hypothetical protein
MQNPLNFDEININNIVYKNIDESGNNKIIFLKYKEEKTLKNFVIQVPKFKCEIKNDIVTLLNCKNNGDYSVNSKKNNFLYFIEKIEKKIEEDIIVYKDIWFNHVKKINKIKFQKSIVDNFPLKIINNKEFQTKIMINNTLTQIHENVTCDCKILLELYAIWINNYNIGIIFRPIIISIIYPEINNYNYRLLDDNDTHHSVCETTSDSNLEVYEEFSDNEVEIFKVDQQSEDGYVYNDSDNTSCDDANKEPDKESNNTSHNEDDNESDYASEDAIEDAIEDDAIEDAIDDNNDSDDDDDLLNDLLNDSDNELASKPLIFGDFHI